jgi:hypothetical protein
MHRHHGDALLEQPRHEVALLVKDAAADVDQQRDHLQVDRSPR